MVFSQYVMKYARGSNSSTVKIISSVLPHPHFYANIASSPPKYNLFHILGLRAFKTFEYSRWHNASLLEQAGTQSARLWMNVSKSPFNDDL